jgi:hypothetical protein
MVHSPPHHRTRQSRPTSITCGFQTAGHPPHLKCHHHPSRGTSPKSPSGTLCRRHHQTLSYKCRILQVSKLDVYFRPAPQHLQLGVISITSITTTCNIIFLIPIIGKILSPIPLYITPPAPPAPPANHDSFPSRLQFKKDQIRMKYRSTNSLVFNKHMSYPQGGYLDVHRTVEGCRERR